MQLYFFRHAQSENNALWEQTGSSKGRNSDPDLTVIGHRQAKLLAEFIGQEPSGSVDDRWDPHNRAGFGLDHLYTSLMIRAVATAVPLARAMNLPLQAWADLHEIGGIYLDEEPGGPVGLPGKDRRYFTQHYPELQLSEDFNDTGWWNRPFEPDEAALGRARRVFDQLLDRHGDRQDRIGLVSHGGFYNAFLSVIFGFAPTPELWLLMNNAAITRLDFHNGQIGLVYHNRADHLPEDLIT